MNIWASPFHKVMYIKHVQFFRTKKEQLNELVWKV